MNDEFTNIETLIGLWMSNFKFNSQQYIDLINALKSLNKKYNIINQSLSDQQIKTLLTCLTFNISTIYFDQELSYIYTVLETYVKKNIDTTNETVARIINSFYTSLLQLYFYCKLNNESNNGLTDLVKNKTINNIKQLFLKLDISKDFYKQLKDDITSILKNL